MPQYSSLEDFIIHVPTDHCKLSCFLVVFLLLVSVRVVKQILLQKDLRCDLLL